MKRRFPARWAGEFLLLGLLAGLSAGVHARLAPNAPGLGHAWSAPLRAQLRAEGFAVLETAEIVERLRAGDHLLLDARPLAEYDRGHLPGALSLPVEEFAEHLALLASILQPDTPLVAYCGNVECDDALRLARRLREVGYANIAVYAEGYAAWQEEEAP